MKKRLCLIITVILLLPVLSAFALNPCEHYPGQVADHELEEVNKIPPQEGVAGSVDLRCPICHQIVDSAILPALPMPAEHPAASDAETPPNAAPQPDPEPVTSTEVFVQPEAPAQPKTQTQAEVPVQQETSAQSKTQVQAEVQAQQETPVQPETPVQSESPARSEMLAQAEAPSQTASDIKAVVSAEGGSPDQSSAAEPPKAQDMTANVPAQTGGSAEGGGTTGSPARNSVLTNTSAQTAADSQNSVKVRTFPYRRIKMKPRPGIRAEAPGDLIWPLYGTPFQDLFSD